MVRSSNLTFAEWDEVLDEIAERDAPVVTEMTEIREAMRVSNTGRVSTRLHEWSSN